MGCCITSQKGEKPKKVVPGFWSSFKDEEDAMNYFLGGYRKSLLLILLHEYDDHKTVSMDFRENTPQRKRLNRTFKEEANR
ncbi:unnamed protein product [Moneuplotes crassus]|uniref:Uncharacterized protein n=1 Tax=Euplotes crassus TaxID=5936 RepID=A0AAD2D8S7_EUPCR|nr:unnamed protein product [Moneuplotes crassus]